MNMEKEESDEEGSDESFDSWVSWFCNQKGCEFFCEVEEDFISNDFNTYGLKRYVRYFDESLDIILDEEFSEEKDRSIEMMKDIHEDAEKLYGLIHSRYIVTPEGCERMKQLYGYGYFGKCPKVHCGCKVLPIGMSDVPEKDNVKVYCPRCDDVFTPRSSKYEKIDGAYFGTSFPHMFFMYFPNLRTKKKKKRKFPLKIFGFRIHEQGRMNRIQNNPHPQTRSSSSSSSKRYNNNNNNNTKHDNDKEQQQKRGQGGVNNIILSSSSPPLLSSSPPLIEYQYHQPQLQQVQSSQSQSPQIIIQQQQQRTFLLEKPPDSSKRKQAKKRMKKKELFYM